jgi:hypothetical protein
LLLALAWFLQVYAEAEIEPSAAYRSLVVIIVVSLMVTAAGIRLLGRDRGTAMAALVIMALITAGDLLRLAPFVVAALLLLVERHWSRLGRVRLAWPRIHEAVSVMSVVLLAIQVGRLLTATTPAPAIASDAWVGQPIAAASRPDVFVLVADAHGRQDVLLDAYGVDDQPFIDSLTALGFQVADSSRANYALTRFSLGSMLIASYLGDLNGSPTTDHQDALARRTIQDNPAFPLLRRAGYEVTVVSGGYEHLGLRSADRFIDTGQPNEFEEALVSSAAVTRWLQWLVTDRVAANVRGRTRDGLAAFLQVASQRATYPRFVFAHLPTPHSPYVFDAMCDPVTPKVRGPEGLGRGAADPDTIAAVRAQTSCLDTLISDAVTELVRRRPDAVILVLSDHGPDEHLNWWEPDRRGLDERSANLFAARTPGRPGLFPDDITLVNVLPLLFNAYLGTDLPIRANEFWFGPRPQDHRFVRVDPTSAEEPFGTPGAEAGS